MHQTLLLPEGVSGMWPGSWISSAAQLTRRQMLRSTSLALGAFVLPASLQALTPEPRAKGVILVMLEGGMSHLDSWDPKPDAPVEIRGEFNTIATSLPGVRICEHMP